MEEMGADDGGHKFTGQGDMPSKRVPFLWAMRTADNRERSRSGATTKHVHIETVDPVTILVTQMAAELGAAGATTFFEALSAHERATARRNARQDSTLVLTQTPTPSSKAGHKQKQSKMVFTKQAAAKKSRLREKQKRWLSEDVIVSLLVPCIELKLLTSLPVPVENLPDPRTPMEGVYCSTVVVRDVQLYLWQKHPPAGVEVSADATRQSSVSLRVATLSLVTQIEYEPIYREGNLRVQIPDVCYDADKDTIGVFFLTEVTAGGKQDVVRGAEGGACHVSVNTVALHLTRDLVDYLFALKDEATKLYDVITHDVKSSWDDATTHCESSSATSYSPASPRTLHVSNARGAPDRLWSPLGMGELNHPKNQSNGDTPTSRLLRHEGEQFRKPSPLLTLGLDRGRTVQGKGFIKAIVLSVVDTRKEGRRIKVDLVSTTRLEIKKPSADFIVMTPQRSRDRNVQLQCVGKVDLVRAAVFPAALHTVYSRGPAPTESDTATTSRRASMTSPLSTPTAARKTSTPAAHHPRQVTLTPLAKNSNRVTFWEENPLGGDDSLLPSPNALSTAEHSTSKVAVAMPPRVLADAKPSNTHNVFERQASGTSASSSSHGPPAGFSRQSTIRGGGGLTNSSASGTSSRPAKLGLFESLNVVYNCSFTLSTLDVSMMHSDMNYVQLKGKSLMGCAESRAEKVSSRECIQMEALAEVISEPMRARLRRKAHSARERASKSRYAAPPNTTEQQQLKSSACFFTQSILVHYVADPVIGGISGGGGGASWTGARNGGESSGPNVFGRNDTLSGDFQSPLSAKLTPEQRKQRMLNAQVVVAIVSDVAVSAQNTLQYDIAGEQTNVAMHVGNILCDSPYRHNAEDVIHPQVHQFITAWRAAVRSLSNRQKSSDASGAPGSPLSAKDRASPTCEGETVTSSPILSPYASPTAHLPGAAAPHRESSQRNPASRWNKAFFLVVQTKTIEAVVSLPQRVTQRFILPELSAFVQGSSDRRVNAKVHIHPFTITSKLNAAEPDGPQHYAVTLPNIYLMYAHDAIKMTGAAMVETVAITVTPLFINHTLLTYEKVSSDVFATFGNAVSVDESAECPSDVLSDARHEPSPTASRGSPRVPQPKASVDNPAGSPTERSPGAQPQPQPQRHARKKDPKRQSFLLLLRGVRISYLTSVTNLRFTIRRVNAVADSAEHVAQKSLHWVIHVTSAQVALVDRNDHDQMVAAVDGVMRHRRQQRQSAAEGVVAKDAFHSKSHGDSLPAGGNGSRYRTRYHSPLLGTREGSRVGAGALPPSVPRGSKVRDREWPGASDRGGSGDDSAAPASVGAALHGRARSGEGSSEDEAHKLRAVHPLSGFIWGSAELSFTLSSGKMEDSQAKIALQKNASFAAYSAELQKALLDSLGHSSSQWKLSVFSPLVILRFGLEDLLKLCFDETREDIGKLKSAAAEENETFRLRLAKHKTFQRLQKERRRYESLVRRTEKERMSRLRQMKAEVASDVTRRRGSLSMADEDAKLMLNCFNTRKENHIVATISHFLVVVPFGDAAFRSLLEEAPDTYNCGKQHRHIHSSSCLSRRKFIPTLALKMRVEETSLICSLESERRFIPVLRQAGFTLPTALDYANEREDGNNGGDARWSSAQTAEADYVNSRSFCGRFMVNNTYMYFTDGSPVDEETNLKDLITDTSVLGGLGILTDYTTEELRRSRNTLYIACVDSPINVESKGVATRVGAVFDLTGPRVQLSSRLVNILSELAMEVPGGQLVRNFHNRHRTYSRETTASKDMRHNTSDGNGVRQPPASLQTLQMAGHRGDEGGERNQFPRAASSEGGRLHVDVSARLGAGSVEVFAHTKANGLVPPTVNQQQGPTQAESRFLRASGSAVARRRVAFDTAQLRTRSSSHTGGDYPASVHRNSRLGANAGTPQQTSASTPLFTQAEEAMESLLAIPLPGVIVQTVMDRGGSIYEEDYNVAKIEVRAGTIELSPSITSLAREIEAWGHVYDHFQQERRKTILLKVQKLEKEVVNLDIPLHNTVEDVLLPMPSTLCNTLSAVRMRNAINLKRSTASSSVRERNNDTLAEDDNGLNATAKYETFASVNSSSNGDYGAATEDFAITQAKKTSKSFSGIHITLTSFRLVLTTEPVASTAFTVFLDEKSSIDLLIKVFRRPSTESKHFLNKFPDLSMVLSVHSLCAECQTKLEVKSLEISLPEAELTVSKRQGTVGTVTAISASFPLSVKGAEPNLILRVQHMAQVLTVAHLWTATVTDTLRSVRQLAARGAAGDVVARKVTDSQFGQRMKETTANLKKAASAAVTQSEHTIVALCVSHGLLRIDLGSGNTHQLFFGNGHLAFESAKYANGSRVILLALTMSKLSVHSEGVLGGIASIGAVFLQLFVIRNKEGGADFIRSPEGRTFREALAVSDVVVTFKERQLRDIFECKIDSFKGNSMDGIGEEGYTTTDLDVSLSHATLGVTPSTAPAFLNFVRTVSALLADQQRVAMKKLKGVAPLLSHAGGSGAGDGSPDSNGTSNEADKEHAQRLDHSARTLFGENSMSTSTVHHPVANGSRRGSGESKQGRNSRRDSNAGFGYIPFMGNKLLRVPCGQLRFTVEDTTLLFGSTSSSPDAAVETSVVASFPKAQLSFAECPCDDYTAVKKAIVIETHNAELYRPGASRVVIMGFKGVNVFDFYTHQTLGERIVGFTLSLRQTHPWTGNPRFRDFEEMVLLIKSFTDKKNAHVFQRFGRVDEEDLTAFTILRESAAAAVGGGAAPGQLNGGTTGSSPTARARHNAPADSLFSEARTPVQFRPPESQNKRASSPAPGHATTPRSDLDRMESVHAEPLLHAPQGSPSDERQLRPLRTTKFSPQLRFGGDVSVNTEVILNWLGITEKMLPNVVNVQLCDKLEAALIALADTASERVVTEKAEKKAKQNAPALKDGEDEGGERM